MPRRLVLLLTVAAAMSASAFGVAAASADTASPDRGITVNGAAQANLAGDATDTQAKAAYNALFGPAIDDAKGKADIVAAKLGVTLGAVTAVVERSDQSYFGCAYAVGVANSGVPVGAVAKTPKPKAKHKKKHKKSAAKSSAASTTIASPPAPGTTEPAPGPDLPPSTCPIQMQVSVTYAIG